MPAFVRCRDLSCLASALTPSPTIHPRPPAASNAAVAGSRGRGGGSGGPAPADKGQAADLAIVEVALYFQHEIVSAAAAASPSPARKPSGEGEEGGGEEGVEAAAAAAAAAAARGMPVALLTNDNGQLALAKSHGLPAFKLANPAFDAALGRALAGGGALTSAALRALLAPAATAGLNAAPAGRGLQEEFDGAVACLRGLSAAYEDLASALADVAAVAFDDARAPAEALSALRALLGGRMHALAFEEARPDAAGVSSGVGGRALSASSSAGSSSGGGGDGGGNAGGGSSATTPVQRASSSGGTAAALAPAGSSSGAGANSAAAYAPLLEAPRANVAALAARLRQWEAAVRAHQTPSRVVKWAM